MALGDLLGGTPAQTKQFQNFTPQQQGVQNNVLSQILSMLQNNQNRQQITGNQQGQNQFDFAPIENQARKNFAQSTVPSLAERFTAMGGGQRSSAFQGALGQAGAGLEDSLAALKSQYGLQQQQFGLQERGQENNLLSSLLGIGFQPSFHETYTPRQPGLLESAGAGLGQGLGQILPLLLGGGGQGLLQILSLLGGQNATNNK